jgi:CRP-like cAMP-binding protein
LLQEKGNVKPLLYNAKQNHLLGALPAEEYARLLPFLELVNMPMGEVLYEPNTAINSHYFPTSSIVARVYELESGFSKQVSMIGNEGVSDSFLLLGCETTPATVIVQSGGYAYEIKSSILKKEFDTGGVLQRLLLRFNQVLFLQTEQLAAANRQTVEQQLSRFLLMSLDRSSSYSLTITQEFVAQMLGVRRESVTEAARSLQASGAIEYRRGHITILKRVRMEEYVSNSYPLLKMQYNHLHHSMRAT